MPFAITNLSDRDKEIKRLYVEEKRSVREVAERVNLSGTRVIQRLNRMGVERRPLGRKPYANDNGTT